MLLFIVDVKPCGVLGLETNGPCPSILYNFLYSTFDFGGQIIIYMQEREGETILL